MARFQEARPEIVEVSGEIERVEQVFDFVQVELSDVLGYTAGMAVGQVFETCGIMTPVVVIEARL
jgi:hypothetical protein